MSVRVYSCACIYIHIFVIYRNGCGSSSSSFNGWMRTQEDEKSELCRFLKIRNVPLFQFYINGEKVEEFATRDKKKIDATLNKYKKKAKSGHHV